VVVRGRGFTDAKFGGMMGGMYRYSVTSAEEKKLLKSEWVLVCDAWVVNELGNVREREEQERKESR